MKFYSREVMKLEHCFVTLTKLTISLLLLIKLFLYEFATQKLINLLKYFLHFVKIYE